MLKKFVVLDGHALIYRGYYALPPLNTSKGELVHAVYGFASILLTILKLVQPDYLAVAFDLKGPTFRHEAYEGYKATRAETPDDLIVQVPRIRQLVGAFCIPVFEQKGYEADDMIGTLSKKITAYPDVEFLIVTGDMDLTQLITDQVKVVSPLNGSQGFKTYDAQAVMDKYGIWPHQMVDYKALVGDVSDNIPGVPGIGEKTAARLLFHYESLNGIYDHLSEISGAVHDKLMNGRASAEQSRHLAQIVCDVPLEFNLAACHTHEVDARQVKLFFEELEFKRLIPRFEELQQGWQAKQQAALF